MPDRRSGFPTAGAVAIAGGVVLVQSLLAGRYGWHRDELYFVAAGNRPAWGYVDQPPLTPLLARLSQTVFGESLVGLRLFSILAVAAVIVVTGLLARAFGGGRVAQVLAAGSAAAATLYLAFGHMFGTSSFDLLFWVLILYAVARTIAGDGRRGWLVVGGLGGLAFLNKHTVVLLGIGLVVGLAATAQRRHLRSPWVWAGGGIALLIAAPNLLWQARHGWPLLEMSAALSEEHGGVEGALRYVPLQIVQLNPVLVLVWVPGLVWLLRSPHAERFRLFAWAWVTVFLLVWLSGGQPYYVGPLYAVLLAAGAVALEARPAAVGRQRLTAVAVGAVISAPVVLPLLPPAAVDTAPLPDVNPEQGEQIGWPALVDTVADVHAALSPAERRTTAIYTANYGEAGAIERYGPARGLPVPVSGHNTYWLWGPPETDGPTIAIGLRRAHLDHLFADCEQVAQITNPHRVENDEYGAPVWVCRGQRAPWPQLWPLTRHYG